MFGLGWAELFVIGIVALIVVGPKELPGMFRNLGKLTAQARHMGRQFTQAMNAAADESGINDLKRDIKDLSDPLTSGLDAAKNAATGWDKFDDSDLDEDRRETARKIREATAKSEADKRAGEQLSKTRSATPVKKPAAKKPATKKATTKKAAPKPPAPKKPANSAPKATKATAKKPPKTSTPAKSDAP